MNAQHLNTLADLLAYQRKQAALKHQNKLKTKRAIGYALVFGGIVLLSALLNQCQLNPQPSVYPADSFLIEVKQP